jgi:hypothetical protein
MHSPFPLIVPSVNHELVAAHFGLQPIQRTHNGLGLHPRSDLHRLPYQMRQFVTVCYRVE